MAMAPQTPKVAFVTGINGVSGNALVEYLIRSPPEEWSKIIISSRSPPTAYWQDPRVVFVALDFLDPPDKLVAAMAPVCYDVTHAYFMSYIHSDDFTKLAELNTPLFANFLTAIDTVAGTELDRVCLQTGGKHFGVHLGPVEAPIHEEMPRYEDGGQNFYYPQHDALLHLASQRSWSWNVIRPNAVIGFAPGRNGMSEALTLALYMLCCKVSGSVPHFPGSHFNWNSCDDNSDATSLADMTVWATTNEHTKNEDFNHANGDVFVWRYFWKRVGRYFGIEIPDDDEWEEIKKTEDGKTAHRFIMGDWAEANEDTWHQVVQEYGGNVEAFKWGSWGFFDWIAGKTWVTVGTVSKARKMGWMRYDDTFDSWMRTFRSLENAGVLPRQPHLRTIDVAVTRSAP